MFFFYLIRAFQLLILIRVVLSWFRMERGNSFSDFVHDFTEPLLSRLRVVFSMGMVGLDLGPILAYLLLELVLEIIVAVPAHPGLTF
ncbi:MAG: YggT family protein [Candidatus Wallbacteria bacterium]|nr:YggT family protein [Candidatus Wallbacteria bacterium]